MDKSFRTLYCSVQYYTCTPGSYQNAWDWPSHRSYNYINNPNKSVMHFISECSPTPVEHVGHEVAGVFPRHEHQDEVPILCPLSHYCKFLPLLPIFAFSIPMHCTCPIIANFSHFPSQFFAPVPFSPNFLIFGPNSLHLSHYCQFLALLPIFRPNSLHLSHYCQFSPVSVQILCTCPIFGNFCIFHPHSLHLSHFCQFLHFPFKFFVPVQLLTSAQAKPNQAKLG